MNYNVAIIDENITLQTLAGSYYNYDELIHYHLLVPAELLKNDTFTIPFDACIINMHDTESIFVFLRKIRQIKFLTYIPIAIINDELAFNTNPNFNNDLVFIFSKQYFSDAIHFASHIRFYCQVSQRFKKLYGENNIIKTKLIELEKLRIKNDFLFTSTKTLEEINQELKSQRDEIELQKREIEAEKRRSEELLKNILPEETSRELMIHGEAKTQFYKKVSVLFSDFQGFTNMCENMHPQDIVRELAIHFSKFEEICEQHYVEKIKTIGDAYMCAGGIPMRNNSNPIDTVLVGLDMIRYLEKCNKEKAREGLRPWNVRIGIHTGNLIAGVIGKKKFAYDIWGDTVNTASRMETSGEVNKINISEDTFQFIKEYFDCEDRGKIEAKGKGLINMYYVLGIKPEYSIEGKGIMPNKDFIVEYSKL